MSAFRLSFETRRAWRIPALLLFTLLAAQWLAPGHTLSGAVIAGRAAGSGSEVIDLVNSLRSANGLAPYRANAALMAAAQAHSEWMAENDTTSHTGAGGSNPGGRAAEAGYSGSGVVENIASGSSMTPAIAVRIWQGDGLHLETMLSASSVDAGAGVAVSADGVSYIALLVGGRGSGSSGVGVSGQNQAATPGSPAAPATPATSEVILAVTPAEPNPDGSILHIVEAGQTLWDIATAYQISLAELYALNGLNDQSVIFPGERLIIRLPTQTLTPSSLQTGTPGEFASGTPTRETPTRAASATPRPATRTPSPTPQTAAIETEPGLSPGADQAAAEVPQPAPRAGFDPLLILIGVFAVVGVGLILVGVILKRSS